MCIRDRNRLESIKEFNVSKRIWIGGGSLRLANNLGQKLDKDTIYTNAKACLLYTSTVIMITCINLKFNYFRLF